MMEYSTVIEVWFDADDDKDAEAVVAHLDAQTLEHPNVTRVATEPPESQE
jgi:hypothetical protein